MKAYKIELLILDFDNIGEENIIHHLENTHYPNHCISPEVKSIVEKNIDNWSDEHPLNKKETSTEEYERIFKE